MTDTDDQLSDIRSTVTNVRPSRRTRRHAERTQRRLLTRAVTMRFGPFSAGRKRPTWAAVAAQCGVDRKTLWRWRQTETYRELLRDHRQLVAEATRLDAAGLARAAVAHLGVLMGEARSEYVQLEAARVLWAIAATGEDREEADETGKVEVFAELLARRQAVLAEMTTRTASAS